jgi:hypothetical protein
MLSRLELIPRSRFPAFLTGSVAEEASIAAQQSRERGFAIVRSFDHFAKNTTARRFCHRRAIAHNLLRKIWQISKAFPAITKPPVWMASASCSVRSVLVENLLR